MQNVFGSVSIHRLRTGATVQLYLSADKGLYQLISGKTASPDWSVAANQPTITPSLIGATMSNPEWYVDGSKITSNSIYNIDAKTGALKFLKSPVNFDDIHNITYKFKCQVTTGGTSQSIERTIMVVVRSGGENSYWGNIAADGGTVLGSILEGENVVDRTETTLKPSLWLGTNTKKYGTDYTVVWKRTGTGTNGADETITSSWTKDAAHGGCQINDDGSLTVTRDGVNGMAHFECHFYADEQHVEAEGIQIADNQDEYFINISGDKNVYTDSGSTVRLQAQVYVRETNKPVKPTSWAVIVTDSERMNEYNPATYGISIDSDGNFSMNERNMFVPNTGSKAVSGKPWLKCGDSSAQDVPVATQADATECDIVVQFIATL